MVVCAFLQTQGQPNHTHHPQHQTNMSLCGTNVLALLKQLFNSHGTPARLEEIQNLFAIRWQKSKRLDMISMACLIHCCWMMNLAVSDNGCYCSAPICCLCRHPVSELFDPPTQLYQCSSGPLSASLQFVYQGPFSLVGWMLQCTVMSWHWAKLRMDSVVKLLGISFKVMHTIQNCSAKLVSVSALFASIVPFTGDFPHSVPCFFLLEPG